MIIQRLLVLTARFARCDSGSIAPIAALSLIPILTGVGAALDYSRAHNFKTGMQTALDVALLAGAREGSSSWSQVASDLFNANIAAQAKSGYAATPNFSKAIRFNLQRHSIGDGADVGSWHHQNHVHRGNRSATAIASEADNSCILTLDHGQPLSHVSLRLNGAPLINLSGCSIRSNTSLDCNGHDGNVTKGMARGRPWVAENPRPTPRWSLTSMRRWPITSRRSAEHTGQA